MLTFLLFFYVLPALIVAAGFADHIRTTQDDVTLGEIVAALFVAAFPVFNVAAAASTVSNVMDDYGDFMFTLLSKLGKLLRPLMALDKVIFKGKAK